MNKLNGKLICRETNRFFPVEPVFTLEVWLKILIFDVIRKSVFRNLLACLVANSIVRYKLVLAC